MNHDLDQVIQDFHQRVFGEELTRVNQLPIEQRRAYVRSLWAARVKRAASSADKSTARESGNPLYQDE